MRPTIYLIVALALAGCGLNSSPSTPQRGDDDGAESANGAELPEVKPDAELAALVPRELRDAGKIRMATQAGYPPFGYTDTDGKTLVGLDIDLAEAIGAKLEIEIVPINTSFDGIIPALQAGRVDMAMASIGDTKEREQQVDFSTYYWNGTRIMVPKGNPKKIDGKLVCDVTIGVIRGSLQQSTFLPAHDPKCKAAGRKPPRASVFQDGPQAQLALRSGRVDGVMQDAPPLIDQVAKSPDQFELAEPLVRNPNPGGAAFPKGSELVEPVNDALNQLIADGNYTAILEKWKLTDIAIEQSTINGALE